MSSRAEWRAQRPDTRRLWFDTVGRPCVKQVSESDHHSGFRGVPSSGRAPTVVAPGNAFAEGNDARRGRVQISTIFGQSRVVTRLNITAGDCHAGVDVDAGAEIMRCSASTTTNAFISERRLDRSRLVSSTSSAPPCWCHSIALGTVQFFGHSRDAQQANAEDRRGGVTPSRSGDLFRLRPS